MIHEARGIAWPIEGDNGRGAGIGPCMVVNSVPLQPWIGWKIGTGMDRNE